MGMLGADVNPGRQLMREIEALRALPTDWDSYGADPVSDEACGRALDLVGYVLMELGDYGSRALPRVGPTPSGVALIWLRARGDELHALLSRDGAEYVIVAADRSVVRRSGPADFSSFPREVLKPFLNKE